MTGDEFLKLGESRAFRQPIMDAAINEFEPAPDAFRLTDNFLPFKEVDKTVLLDLINNGAFGRTNPVNLGADHKRISIPGSSYKEHTSGHWREAVQFGEQVLQEAVDPAVPTKLWGDGLASAALNFLDLRLNTLIEYVTSKILIDGTFSEARYGVNYTYDPKIPAKYYVDVASSPPWSSGGVWHTVGSATPVADMIGAVNYMATKLGLVAETAFMSINTLEEFYLATATQTMVTNSPALVEGSSNRKKVFDTLTGLTMEKDNRIYAEESRFVEAAPVADTTLVVTDASEFTAADVITLRNTIGEEEEATISSISGNTITVSAGISKAYLVGDRVTVYKQFLTDGYVLIKAVPNDRVMANNWISTPSLVKAQSWTKPLPGRYIWTHFDEKVPYTLEVGAGISGGPKITRPTWIRIKV
jgi:hypothetical protein